MKNFFKNLYIRPKFFSRYRFIGILPFEYDGQGFFLLILPMLGFVVRWDGTHNLEKDLQRLKWN